MKKPGKAQLNHLIVATSLGDSNGVLLQVTQGRFGTGLDRVNK